MSKALMTPYVCFAKRTYCECAAKLLKIYENKNFMVYWLKKTIFFIHSCHDKGKNSIPCITLLGNSARNAVIVLREIKMVLSTLRGWY